MGNFPVVNGHNITAVVDHLGSARIDHSTAFFGVSMFQLQIIFEWGSELTLILS